MKKPNFLQRDMIAIQDFSREELLYLLNHARLLKKKKSSALLSGKILASCFFEPSTRTRLSFEAAMHRLGGAVIGFSDIKVTSLQKGESFYDSMKMVENYADAIVLRHPLEGSSQYAADALRIPVINAGDGSNQHPTQTLLDLFSIEECQGTLENLHIAIAGDLKFSRTAHSLSHALTHFNPRLYFLGPPALEMPKEICEILREKGIKFSFHQNMEEVLSKVDILYMTRIQQERFLSHDDYQSLKNSCLLKMAHLKKAKKNLKIFHALPRINEIETEIDHTSHAYYFEQAKNGLYVRQALLGLILGALK